MQPPRQARFDAGEHLLAVDDRLAQVPEEVDGSSEAALDEAIELIGAALLLVDDVLRRIPADGVRVPDGELWSRSGRALLASAPERFERAGLELLRAALEERRGRLAVAVSAVRRADLDARGRAMTDLLLEGLRNGPTPEQLARREADEQRQQALLQEYHAQVRARAAAARASAPAWARVLAEPGSLRARDALLAEWKQRRDPRAELLEAQLEMFRHRRANTHGSPEAQALYRKVNLLVARDGKRLAGDLAGMVLGVEYCRGLVAGIVVSGATFRSIASMLFERAPIQHLTLTAPLGPIEPLFQVPELARIVSLRIHGLGHGFGDVEAAALARSSFVTNVRWLNLGDNALTRAGVELIARSPNLGRVAFLALEGNPGQEVLDGVVDPEDWPPDREDFAVAPDEE